MALELHVSSSTNLTKVDPCRTSPTGLSAQTRIGMYVSVGQACVLRSTTIEDECIIGNKCVLMEGSLVEKNSILAPGTVVAPGRLIPSGQLWSGNPARFVRDLTRDEVGSSQRLLFQIWTVCPRIPSFICFSFHVPKAPEMRFPRHLVLVRQHKHRA